MYLLQTFTCYPFPQQVTEDILDLARAANHANIAGGGFECGTQGVLIKVMTTCDDDNPAGLVRFQLTNGLWNIAECNLYLIAEHVRISQVTSIIDDNNAVVELCYQACQRLSYV